MNPPVGQPRFLSVEEVIRLQQLAILEFGGSPGLRDLGMLESALHQPRAGISSGFLHTYPFEMAAAYGFHLARNHCFVDGNKRIAWIAMRTFLWREGYTLRVPAPDAVDMMLRVAVGGVDKSELAGFLMERAEERPRRELRDFFARLTFDQLRDKLVAIAQSYQSGGADELTAIITDATEAMPVLRILAHLYVNDREHNENAIHFIQVLCALYRIAEDENYEW